ncbi:MAG: response regulator [Candidatus Omnitrophota bacterium]
MPAKKILVADDETSIALLMKIRLVANGYEVITASDGVEAFEKFIAEKPDLLITDVLMPKMTGYQLVEKIKALDLPVRNTPILVISAKNTMRDFFEHYHVTEFIPKSFKPEELLAKVSVALGLGVPSPAAPAPAVETRPSGRPETRSRVLLTGCKKFILEKIQEHLEAQGFSVILCMDEEEAIEEALRNPPRYVVCQFWDDAQTFDAVKIREALSRDPAAARIPFIVFLEKIPSVRIEAMKTFPEKQMILYKESPDILRKLDEMMSSDW